MALEVIFVADDFGATAEINRAIVKAHRDGALHGASLMMGQPGADDAVALAQKNPTLKIGWHLHLCDSQPVTRDEWPWSRHGGIRAGFQIALSGSARELMRREVRAQWDMFQATGLRCDFVNSHHHLHSHPLVYRQVLEVLPSSFSGWMRLGQPRFFDNHSGALSSRALGMLMRRHRRNCHGLRASQTLWGIDRTFRMDAGEVIEAARTLPDGLHEFIFHPRKMDGDKDLDALLKLKSAPSHLG